MFICKSDEIDRDVASTVKAHNFRFNIAILSLQMTTMAYAVAILTPINNTMIDRAPER